MARGTIRAFEDLDQASGAPSIRTVLENYVAGAAAALGVTAELEIVRGPPPTVNDVALFSRILPRLRTAWSGTLDTSPYRGMFAEDFAYYTGKVPALYFGLGIAREGQGEVDVHKENFTIHQDALVQGVQFLVTLAEVSLREKGPS